MKECEKVFSIFFRRCFYMPNDLDAGTLELHKEELQITKNMIKTADVKVYKKTFTEEKQITVPLTREELIIEKKVLDPNGAEPQIEIIRIPIVEERIEVTKKPVILENVEISKNQFEEMIHLNETLKEEKINIETIGDIKVREENEPEIF
jgi:uncharacterized protein (TIGR02271 family)